MKVDYNKYLDLALESLFRPIDENGFWLDSEKRIIFRLDMSKDPNNEIYWKPDLNLEYRYGPYALMGVLYWRSKNKIESSKYDNNLINYSSISASDT